MKNILNAISAILIVLFLGWMICGDCCETKCEKSGATKCEKSGATKCDYSKCDYSKCKSSKTKKECPHANKKESIITEGEDTTAEEKINIEEVINTENVDESTPEEEVEDAKEENE